MIAVALVNTLYAQDEKLMGNYHDIDSIHELYYGEYSEGAYIISQKLLRASNRLSYAKGMLNAYKSLMWYHGSNPDKNIDSVLFYANLFESKIALEEQAMNTELLDSIGLPKYYLFKGAILANRFGLIEQGLEAYFKSYPLINNDIDLLVRYHVFVSNVYFYKQKYDKALENLLPCLKDTARLSDSRKIQLLQSIAATYVMKGVPEKSHPINQKILAVAQKNNDEKEVWWTKNEMSYDYHLFGDHQKAIDSALAIRNIIIKNNYHQPIFNNTVYLSAYYYAIGDLDNAIAYEKKAMESPYSIQHKMDVFNTLAGYYSEKKEYLKAIEVYSKKDSVVDSIRSMEQAALTSYIDSHVKLLMEKHKNQQMLFDMELLEEKNKKQKLYLFSLVIVLISAVLLIGVIYLFRKYRKGERQIEVLKINEKKLLEEQIILRENELEASAIALTQRLEVLNTIKSELDVIKKPQIAQLGAVKKKIHNLIKSASDASIVRDKIESQYPTITAALKKHHPNLSDTEIRYCLLTKLNLTIKESAALLNVTPDTVKVARSRLKKKMGIPAELSFKVFLDQMSQIN